MNRARGEMTDGGWRGWSGADRTVLAVSFAAVGGGLGFLAVAGAVTRAASEGVDERILRAFRTAADPAVPVGPVWVREAVRDVTGLGGPAVLTLVTASLVGYLTAGLHRSAALLVLAAVVGGAVLSAALKDAFARPRPAVVPHLTIVANASFPSGHAMLSAVVYLTLGALLARLVTTWWAKAYFVAVAVALAGVVGLSRVYLGVHYPSDVAAGWAAGTAWASFCWLVARRLQRRGVVDRDAS